MQTIDLTGFIEAHGLDPKEVAAQLFPGNRHPKHAFNRVASGESQLNGDQISKLALLAGVPVIEVYSAGPWKLKATDGLYRFENGDFVAELNTKTWITSVFDKGSLFHESIIHSKTIPLSDYLRELNEIIKNR